MAKRARGSSSRPGQRAPLQRGNGAARSTTSPGPTAPRPATLTPEEEARAAALEAQIVADEKSAEEAKQRTRTLARRSAGVEPGVRTGSIAVRASEEYAYVARDVRRIAVIGGSLVAFLIGLWVVVQVMGIGPF